MAERYFLIILVALTVAGSLWLSFINPAVSYGLVLASLLALLGIASLANAASASKAGVLMPLFFIAAIAYEFYLYLNLNGRFSYILLSISLLSLVGMVLGFSIHAKKGTAKTQIQAPSPSAANAAKRQPRKRAAEKSRKRRRK